MSPEVQDRGVSDLTKKTYVLQKFSKKLQMFVQLKFSENVQCNKLLSITIHDGKPQNLIETN